MNFLNKFIIFLFLFVLFGCKKQNKEQQLMEGHPIDSVMEARGEKFQEANKGIKKGFEESKEELKDKTKELFKDTIPH